MIHTHHDFISSPDIQNIKNKVYELQDYYRPVRPLPTDCDYSKMSACTLGNAIYAHKKINREINKIVKNNFTDLHQITIDRLKSIFNIETIYLSDFSVPGFHIFRGKEINGHLDSLHFHTDKTLLDHPAVDSSIVDPSFMYSFMSLIENTDDPSYLDLEDHKYYYEYGDLNIWSADVCHRIGASTFGESDSRITYQGHIFKMKNTDDYYLYF